MPVLDRLKDLAEVPVDPIPPTWALVFYLMITHDSAEDAGPGAAVAASGEASLFSYDRKSIAPMYLSTIGGNERLKVCTGYAVTSVRTTDPEEAFRFVRDGIDSGGGVFVAGPEIGLCYGYSDPGAVRKRVVYGVSNWGPAFSGRYSWSRFRKHVQAFGDAEGFAYVRRESEPGSAESILRLIAMTVIDWQQQHPGVKFGMQQESYGTVAFRHFIEDLRDPATRAQIEGPYINCHAILFQSGGRYWMG